MAILSGRLPVFTLIILGKILLMRVHIFPNSPFPAIILELASVFVLVGLIEMATPKEKLGSFVALDMILSTLFLSMVMYYDHFGRILDYHVLLQAPFLKDIGNSLIDLFAVKYLMLYLDLALLTSVFFIRKKLKKVQFAKVHRKNSPQRIKQLQRTIVMVAVAFFLCLSAILTYPEKDNLMPFAKNAGILNAEIYTVFQSWGNEEPRLLPTDSLTQANIDQIKQLSPIHWPKYFGVARGKNLIMIQLESTQNFVIGLTVNGQEVTPNLNRLAKDSLYFPRLYSQIAQGNTSDAEFIINTSIYPLATRAISSVYQGIEIPSLPRLLKTKGYSTMTFHPNVVTFWNRDKLYPALGFERYYDKSFYKDEDMMGRWGSSDEILFQKGLPVLLNFQKQNQPFYASFITLSNHHPYPIPKDRRHLKLSDDLNQTFIGNYLTAVNYEDYALGRFFDSLKASGLWENTVIVVYGDHFGINNYQSANYQEDLKKLLGRKHDALDALNVPLIMKVPGITPQTINRVGGQVDILPTLANLFGISLENQLVFGQDLLNTKNNLIGLRYYYPEGTFISEDLFHVTGNEGLYRQEEDRIKQLMQLSDQYLEGLRGREKLNGVKVEVSPI